MVNPEKYVFGASKISMNWRMVPKMNKMRKMKNKKGFTLMEMLIVVAIIAILIAIAIPTFASSLNKARVATDEANIRSGYASVMTDVLMDENYSVEGGTTKTDTYKLNKDGSVTKDNATDAYLTQGKNDNADTAVAGNKVGKWDKGVGVTYTYDYSTGKVQIKVGTTTQTGDTSSNG